MKPNVLVLAVRIRAELSEIHQVVERAQRLLAKAIASNDADYYDGIALNLHSFYTAIERILEDIAREIDGAIPTGQNSHRDLLIQMSAEIPNSRPPVIQRQSRYCLDEYRGLRHVIRNVYTFNLKPERLQELVTALPDCYQFLVHDLTDFCQFLEALTESDC
ncbi:MAG: hypothetical protein SFY66_25795 [Oculatellaceae cyanobacterium bins.114]|nr:hypothetical protein [Oculatellaceae cyanobacterium bins.114]